MKLRHIKHEKRRQFSCGEREEEVTESLNVGLEAQVEI